MKLAWKLALGLIAAISTVMVLHAYVQVRREVALFEGELAKDHRIIGRRLRAFITAVWQTAGEDGALELVHEVDELDSDLHIRWLWADRAGPETLSADVTRALRSGREATLIRRDATGDQRRYTYVPVPTTQGRLGVIELSESRAAERQHIAATEWETLLATLAMIATCAAITFGLGYWFVGRPIGHLSDVARRVGTGDLSGRLALRQRDEIGELGQAINTMCDRLSLTLEELRHADRLKVVGELASGVAHELGAPLNVVAARAKKIWRAQVSGDEAAQNARIIAEQADRMTAIVRQLLDFSRRRGPTPTVGDLYQITEEALAMLAPLATRHQVTFSITPKDQPVPARVDQHQMQQALTNIVLNGIQAMPNGGELRVAIGRQRARPPADHPGRAGDYLCVSFEDDGEGIPADDLPHLFEPFFTTKKVGEGTGLGLALAHDIVRDHGGWISVESQVGKGSRFSILLPAAAAPAAALEVAS